MRINVRKDAIEVDRLRRSFERKLEGRLKRLFNKGFRRVSNDFPEWEQASVLMTAELDLVLRGFMRDVVGRFSQRVLRNRGIKFDVETIAQNYIREQGARNIRGISQYTRSVIKGAILSGYEDGIGNAGIQKKLRELGGDITKRRAAVIARTETHTASNYANHNVNKEFLPQSTMKQWVATSDLRTRSHHASMNGKKVNIDEDFEVPSPDGLRRMMYAGDPKGGSHNVINCRCTVIYIAPDDDVVGIPETVKVSEEPWMFKDGIKPNYRRESGVFGVSRSVVNRYEQDADGTALYAKRKGLTADEYGLINEYTGSSYREINNTMRKWFKTGEIDKSLAEESLGHYEVIKSGFAKLPAYKDFTHRGIEIDPDEFIKNLGIKKGSKFRTESYWSTSKSSSSAFRGDVILVIDGKSGRDISKLSQFEHEQEVLFLPSTEFTVEAIDRSGSKTYIYLNEDDGGSKSIPIEAELFIEALSNAKKKQPERFNSKINSQNELFSIDNRLITK